MTRELRFPGQPSAWTPAREVQTIRDARRPRAPLPIFELKAQCARYLIDVPAHVLEVLTHCGSAAELNFVGHFAMLPGVGVVDHRCLRRGDTDVRLQSRAAAYRIDLMAERGGFRLAIEIDGMAFHHRTADQVQADYLRERRLVAVGYSVVRFTAAEVFRDRAECWRQVESILRARGGNG